MERQKLKSSFFKKREFRIRESCRPFKSERTVNRKAFDSAGLALKRQDEFSFESAIKVLFDDLEKQLVKF